MARGAASHDDGSSSSGFSSDEDMADASQQSAAASSVPNVRVEVLNEASEVDPNAASRQASLAAPSVLQCCLDAAKPVLETETPYVVQYDQYTAAIAHLTWHWPNSETADVETAHSLRSQLYRRFQKAFPLTEAMYLQWLSDARAAGEAGDEVKRLLELAAGDYWSVTLSLQKLKFVRESGDDAALKREMQQAQKTVGAHFARGNEVWALCRELTAEMLDEQEDAALKKEQAVRELFCKQMQLPLDQNDLAMSEFRAWDAYNTLDRGAAGAVLEEASKRQSKVFAPLMKKLRGFETRVSAAPGTEDAANPEQTWTQYLNFVKHRVAPLMSSDSSVGGVSDEGRLVVVCLYERAVSAMCLSPTLWASYLEFLEPDRAATSVATGLEGNTRLDVARRAVRNVSFDSSAWTELLIEMERRHKTMDEITQLVRTELLTRSSPPIMNQFHFLSIMLTWCDVVRRHASTNIDGESLEDTVQQVESLVGSVFTDCEQFMAKTFPDFLEGVRRLMEYRAKCYWSLMPPGIPRLMPATVMKVNKIKQVWQQILTTPLGEQAVTWLAYFEALQHTNAFSVSSLRAAVFEVAAQRVKDLPVSLAERWLVFERENGDLANYLRARRYHAKVSTILPAAMTSPETPSAAVDKKSKGSKKRKANAIDNGGKQPQSTPKRAKAAASKSGGTTLASTMVTDKSKPTTQKAVENRKAHESLTNEHTLFLCNIAKDASKEDVEALFKDIAGLKEVRLVVKMRGDRVKSRGMAYAQFTDEAGMEEGLKKNGSLLDGHPVSVQRSKPPQTSASTPSSTSSVVQKTDPVTLFVGDLNPEKTKQQVTEEQLQVSLQQAMQSAGELVVVTRVSILKDRHGKLKNYGLVEVAEPSQLAFCLANTVALQAKLGEQVTLKPSRFSITHILEQQEKQKKQTQERKMGASVSAGRGGSVSKRDANAPHAKPSTRLSLPTAGSATSLMPRALRRKLAAQDNAAKTKAAKTDPASVGTVTPKSNEDFRKMLFKK